MPQRNSVPLNVYRNGILTTELQVLSITESAGAERLDSAQLLYPALNLEGREFHSQITNEEIEIQRADTLEVLHWGKVGIVTPQLDPRSEALEIVSRMEKFHIGARLNGYRVWNPIKSPPGVVTVDNDLVFNPIIDGRLWPNMNDTKFEGSLPLVLDPESARTAAARLKQGANTTRWILSRCVQYLLGNLNGAETYVDNPSYAQLQAAFSDSLDVVQNVKIPRGAYLAEALDYLLLPLGYIWRIKRTGIGARTFEFINRRSGTLVWVRHQTRGSNLNLAEQNVVAAGLRFDVSQLANDITIVGGYKKYEVTVELARGWDDADDALTIDDLAKDHVDFEDRKDVYRKWVLNEAGDYIGLRPELTDVFTTAFRTAMNAEFGSATWVEDFAPRRRKLLPTLTLDDDHTPIGKTDGVEVEYQVSGGDWTAIGNWGCKLLEHEAGVYFDKDELPEEFFADPSTLKVRVTACIVSDARLEGYAAAQPDSPQSDFAELVIDTEKKFVYQIVTTFSKYAAQSLTALSQDDSAAIQQFAERVRATWDLMDVGGVVQLEGLDATDGGVTYQVGQRVRGLLGKLLSFRAKNGADEFPQIVAIDRNILQQSMTLHLQRYTDPLVGANRGRRRSA